MSTNIYFYKPIIGADVEFFIKKNRKLIGSEKLLKGDEKLEYDRGSFVKDGVQMEINPSASYCREILGTSIAYCFQSFGRYIKNVGIKACFNECINVPIREFKTLSESSKRLGCDPDFNAHLDNKQNVKVSGASTRMRTAGGHIHFGANDGYVCFTPEDVTVKCEERCILCNKTCKRVIKNNVTKIPSQCFGKTGDQKISIWDLLKWNDLTIEEKTKIVKDSNINIPKECITNKVRININGFALETILRPDIFIPICDLICGIPSVLIDRDPSVAKRRTQYGKAGDFRYQPHGIEYRTLSNFWIKNYTLMHLFTGLARTAFLVASSDINNKTNISEKLWSLVNKEDVIRAINTSDFRLARDIWLKIEDVIIGLSNDTDHFPINIITAKAFKQFVVDGVDKHVGKDPIKNWSARKRIPWETYADLMIVNNNIDKIFAEYEEKNGN